jgi:hypothetical protein
MPPNKISFATPPHRAALSQGGDNLQNYSITFYYLKAPTDIAHFEMPTSYHADKQ